MDLDIAYSWELLLLFERNRVMVWMVVYVI